MCIASPLLLLMVYEHNNPSLLAGRLSPRAKDSIVMSMMHADIHSNLAA